MKILDISKYQPNVDYKTVAQNIDGVILRIGITYWGKQDMGIDPYFEKHYAGFKAVGCPVGVYYYSAADNVEVAKKEAEFCLSLMKGKQFELPVFYDVENNERQGKLTKQQLTDIVDVFCSTIEKQGYFVGYYSYTVWLQTKFNTNYLSSKYTLWKADYRLLYDKKIACSMHQYTSKGTVPGINGNVDLNNCFVDYETIIKEKGLNGFNKPFESVLSKEPTKLVIGQASIGDINSIIKELEKLGINNNQVENGFITTSAYVSYGDKIVIERKCNSLNVGIKDYVETPKPPIKECEECKTLKLQIKELTQKITLADNEILKINNELLFEKSKSKELQSKINQIKEFILKF